MDLLPFVNFLIVPQGFAVTIFFEWLRCTCLDLYLLLKESLVVRVLRDSTKGRGLRRGI
jgi:hypothetical protein